MTDEHEFQNPDHLELPLEAAIQATLAEPLHEEAIERVKVRAKLLAQSAPLALTRETAVEPKRSPFSRTARWSLGVIAAALLMAVGGTLFLNHAASHALADVIAKVKAAGTVSFSTSTRFGQQPEITGQMSLSGQKMRFEQFSGMLVNVADFERKEAIVLDGHRKLAQSIEISSMGGFVNPVEQLRQAKTDNAESLGEEVIGQRTTRVYRLKQVELFGMKGNAEMMIWVDSESDLPARITIRDTDPKALMQMRFDDFVWDAAIDSQLFSLQIPEGYQPGKIMLDAAPPASSGTSNSPAIVENLLQDKVPSHLVWGPQGRTMTALTRDPESVAPQNSTPNQIGTKTSPNWLKISSIFPLPG